MRSSSMLALLLLGTLALSAPLLRVAAEDEDLVTVLTEANFDEKIKGSKFALVEFYAPWCGHCKKLEPAYKAAASSLKNYRVATDGSAVLIAKVDATEQPGLGKKFEVKGYPTIKWFIDGEVAGDYQGPRDADGIVAWIKKKTGPFAIGLNSADELKAAEAENEIIVFAHFAAGSAGTEYLKKAEYYKTIATKTEDVPFYMSTQVEVAKAAGLGEGIGFSVIKNVAGEAREVAVMSGDVTLESLEAFILGEKMPPTIEFNAANSNKIFKSGINKQIITWGKAKDMAADSETMKVLRAVSKAFKGKLVFVTSNSESSDAEPITKFFGLAGQEGPVAMGFFMEKNTKYRFSGEFTEKALSAFAQSLVDGTAEADYKSAPIPTEPLDEGVAVVVGKNFNDIVLNPKADVMLEVYAPWCGHCKTLAPIYVQLAAAFKDVDSVVIAKMDGTENEHAKAEAKGYPTLLFFPAGDAKNPIPYQGERSLTALKKFIQENAKSKFEMPSEAASSDADEDEDDEEDEKDEL